MITVSSRHRRHRRAEMGRAPRTTSASRATGCTAGPAGAADSALALWPRRTPSRRTPPPICAAATPTSSAWSPSTPRTTSPRCDHDADHRHLDGHHRARRAVVHQRRPDRVLVHPDRRGLGRVLLLGRRLLRGAPRRCAGRHHRAAELATVLRQRAGAVIGAQLHGHRGRLRREPLGRDDREIGHHDRRRGREDRRAARTCRTSRVSPG